MLSRFIRRSFPLLFISGASLFQSFFFPFYIITIVRKQEPPHSSIHFTAINCDDAATFNLAVLSAQIIHYYRHYLDQNCFCLCWQLSCLDERTTAREKKDKKRLVVPFTLERPPPFFLFFRLYPFVLFSPAGFDGRKELATSSISSS